MPANRCVTRRARPTPADYRCPVHPGRGCTLAPKSGGGFYCLDVAHGRCRFPMNTTRKGTDDAGE